MRGGGRSLASAALESPIQVPEVQPAVLSEDFLQQRSLGGVLESSPLLDSRPDSGRGAQRSLKGGGQDSGHPLRSTVPSLKSCGGWEAAGRADRPQLRPRGAGEDSTQLPPPFSRSTFCHSGAQRATDGGAALSVKSKRYRVQLWNPARFVFSGLAPDFQLRLIQTSACLLAAWEKQGNQDQMEGTL